MNGFKFLLLALFLLLNQLAFEARAASPTGNFIGHVLDSEAFIAVVTYSDKALAYVCDGGQVAEWFRGPVAEDGSLELISANGWTLRALINTDGATGFLSNQEGTSYLFSSTPPSGDAGLYRVEHRVGDVLHVGGWIIGQNGRQRGAVIGGGTHRASSNLNPRTLHADVEGLGTFAAEPVTPAYVDALVTP